MSLDKEGAGSSALVDVCLVPLVLFTPAALADVPSRFRKSSQICARYSARVAKSITWKKPIGIMKTLRFLTSMDKLHVLGTALDCQANTHKNKALWLRNVILDLQLSWPPLSSHQRQVFRACERCFTVLSGQICWRAIVDGSVQENQQGVLFFVNAVQKSIGSFLYDRCRCHKCSIRPPQTFQTWRFCAISTHNPQQIPLRLSTGHCTCWTRAHKGLAGRQTRHEG